MEKQFSSSQLLTSSLPQLPSLLLTSPVLTQSLFEQETMDQRSCRPLSLTWCGKRRISPACTPWETTLNKRQGEGGMNISPNASDWLLPNDLSVSHPYSAHYWRNPRSLSLPKREAVKMQERHCESFLLSGNWSLKIDCSQRKNHRHESTPLRHSVNNNWREQQGLMQSFCIRCMQVYLLNRSFWLHQRAIMSCVWVGVNSSMCDWAC